MPLHLKYRPKSIDEMFGNKEMLNGLRSVLEREEDLPQAWLFFGPRGCGKSTLGRIVAEALMGQSIECRDYYQVDGGDVKANTIKEIKEAIRFKPFSAKRRVWLIEEAHMIGQGGASEKNVPQNNFLTTLEEPPKHVAFILCTTDPQRLIKTIHSRCHTFQVNPLSDKEMNALLMHVLKEEEIRNFPSNAIEAIIDKSEGSPRDALKILDQVIDCEDDAIIGAINTYETTEAEIKELFYALLKKESWPKISNVLTSLRKNGRDCESIRRDIMNYMNAVALNYKPRRGDDTLLVCTDLLDIFDRPTYNSGWPMLTGLCLQAFHTK
jgi:DNA polymerase-3 subunit gamma/tau